MSEIGGFLAGSIFAKLTLDNTGFHMGMVEAKKDEAALSAQLVLDKQKFKELGTAMTVAGTAITAAFGGMLLKASQYGEEINKLSQKTGISAIAMSSFKLALDKSDISFERFTIASKTLAQSMVEAKNSGSIAAKIFDFLKVKTADAAGNLLPMKDVLLDVADAFSKMPDGAQKAMIAVNLFGRGGLDMVKFLNMGKDGLQANIDKAKEYGLVIGTEAAKAGEHFKESMDELKGSLMGVGLTIGNMLLPMAEGLIGKVKELVVSFKTFAADNPTLAAALSSVALAMGAVMVPLGLIIANLPRLVSGFYILRTALHETALGMAAVGAALAAVAAGTVWYIQLLGQKVDAENRAKSAEQLLIDKENADAEALGKAAVAAKWKYGEMANLITAYNGNYAALIMAIDKEKYGTAIKIAYHQAVHEATEQIKAHQAALAGLGPQLDLTSKKEETLAEKLNLVFRAQLLQQIFNDVAALVKFRDALPADEVGRLTKDIQDCTDRLNGWKMAVEEQILPAAKNMGFVFDALAMETMTWSEKIAFLGQKAKMTFTEMADNLKYAMDVMVWGVNQAMGRIGGAFPAFPQKVKVVTEKSADYFRGLYSEISTGMAQVFEGIINGTEKFSKIWTGIWDSIKKAFAKILANMVADYVTKFIKVILEKTGLLKGLEVIFNSVFGAILGGIGSIFGGAAAAAGAGVVGGAAGETMALGPQAAGTAALGSAAAGTAALSGNALLTTAAAGTPWAAVVGFVGLWVGTLVSMLNKGKKLEQAIYNSWDKWHQEQWDKWVATGGLLTSLPKNVLKAGGTPTQMGHIGSYQAEEPVESLWSILGLKTPAGKGASAAIPFSAVPITDPRKITPGSGNITVNVNLNGQMITDRDYVRGRLLPEIESALSSNVFRHKIQMALGVGRG
jgi:TP901 family phage tail tape measure protein